MGTHPIFESDFDCLTDLKIDCKNGQSATEVEGSEGEGCLWRRKEVKEEVVQGKGPRQARQRLRLRSGHLRQGDEGSSQLQGHHSFHRLRSYEDPWLPCPNCHQATLRRRQDQVPRSARIPDGLHPGYQPRGVILSFQPVSFHLKTRVEDLPL